MHRTLTVVLAGVESLCIFGIVHRPSSCSRSESRSSTAPEEYNHDPVSILCTNISNVYKYQSAYKYQYCVQISVMCTNISTAYKYQYCVQISVMCTNISNAYKYQYCVQISVLRTNISNVYKYQ